MIAILIREWRSMFNTPFGYVVLALAVFLLACTVFLLLLWQFTQQQALLVAANSQYGITAFVCAPLMRGAVIALMLIVPLLSMRAVSEEWRSGSIRLLLSSPQSTVAIVMGKFLALFGFTALLLAIVTLMPLSLLLGGKLDFGLLGSAIVGAMLSAASFCSIGLFISSLTTQPAFAAAATLLVCAALWLVEPMIGTDEVITTLAYVSLREHLDPMLRGLLDSADVAYFAILIFGGLILTMWRLHVVRNGT